MAPPAGQPKVAYCWELQGELHWFHYTSAEYARAIAVERYFVVGEGDHQGRGSGLYIAARNPLELTQDELLTELFSKQRRPEAVEAVVVLRRDEERLPTKKVGHKSYLYAAEPGEAIDLSACYRGFGVRDHAAGGWLFSQSLHAVRTA